MRHQRCATAVASPPPRPRAALPSRFGVAEYAIVDPPPSSPPHRPRPPFSCTRQRIENYVYSIDRDHHRNDALQDVAQGIVRQVHGETGFRFAIFE